MPDGNQPKLRLIQGGGEPITNEERWQRFSDRIDELHTYLARMKEADELRNVQESWRPKKKSWRP